MKVKTIVRSLTGQVEIYILPDEMVAMQTPQGIAYQARPRGRVVIPPEGVSVTGAQLKALQGFEGYGQKIISNEDLAARIEAGIKMQAGATKAAPSVEDLMAKVAQLEKALAAKAPAKAPADDLEKAAPADDDEGDEPTQREIKGVRSPSAAIKYCVQQLGASPDQLQGGKDAISAFAASKGITFPNL